jgi:acetyl-CoA/propionyl-CoA carboxylase, biotin carboxylase, biotin carboxyl carrier protein
MNTRLQVKHPVTEAVTGRDLVADQIRIAAGEPLGFEQGEVGFTGHAIEARLYAEDPEHGFLPATGRIARLEWPSGPGIRVDAGIAEGLEISDRFDPMLAKVVAHGTTRSEALGRLATALDETLLLGVTTNLRFLRWLVRRPEVTGGEARTDTLDRIWPPAGDPPAPIPDDAWATAAAAFGGAWRLNAPPLVRLEADGGVRSIGATPHGPGTRAWVRAADEIHVDIDGRSVAFASAPPPDVDRAARSAAAHGHVGGPVDVTAPMPGSVVSVHVAAGASVDAGDPIATLEAMKMEHAVTSPIPGVVTELRISAGDQVARGQLLATLDPDAVVDSNTP